MEAVRQYTRGMRSFEINGKTFTDESLPYVIAEVGHNHQGNLETALKMIEAAAKSGANAVKLQKRANKKLYSSEAYSAPYVSENAYGATYGEHREALEFGHEEYVACINRARESNIDFFATAFDFESADFLMELNVPAFKVASGDLKSIQLIKYIAKFGKPLILSTGGGKLDDIDLAVDTVLSENSNLALLQCTAGYPPEYNELNLNVIRTFRERFPTVTIGYSGHDSGISMALVSYILGARVIEKHFTLNRAFKGTDHAFSLEPLGMSKMIRDLKRAQEALGDGVKRPYPSEENPIKKMGKSLYATRDIRIGEKLQEGMFDFRSPAIGIAPSQLENFIDREFSKSVSAGTVISESDF
jgi:N-acetylneuraminate synthase/sialic acid synthase